MIRWDEYQEIAWAAILVAVLIAVISNQGKNNPVTRDEDT